LADAMRDPLNAKRCSRYLRALADPERLRIVQCLRAGPLPVSGISSSIKSPLANVSHHLKQLRLAGLVSRRKEGRQVIYALSDALATVGAQVEGDRRSLNVLEFGCCRLELGPR
jgi:ArsR family transcriptional regulator